MLNYYKLSLIRRIKIFNLAKSFIAMEKAQVKETSK